MSLSLAHGGALKLSLPPSSRWRSGVLGTLLALAVPLGAGASVAQATPNARAKLVSTAEKTPNKDVVALVEFTPGLSEAKARDIVRAHEGTVTDRLPSISGFAVTVP